MVRSEVIFDFTNNTLICPVCYTAMNVYDNQIKFKKDRWILKCKNNHICFELTGDGLDG